jgi:hypothetical protein
MRHENDFAICWPYIYVVNAITIDIQIVWFKVIAGQILESAVRCSKNTRSDFLRHRNARYEGCQLSTTDK